MLSKATLKYIQSLAHKKFRDQYGVFIAEGTKIIDELLKEGNIIPKIICGRAKWIEENKALLAKSAIEELIEINEAELAKASMLSTPNSVIGVFYSPQRKESLFFKGKITLVLDDIRDPGNMGSIIRIADWFNIENIICSPSCVDYLNPKVIQSSMGSIGRVNIYYEDIAPLLQRNSSIQSFAAALNGKDISTITKIKEGLIIIGNESRGITREIMNLANEKITIPKYGNAESLNAAVATGIILSHLV